MAKDAFIRARVEPSLKAAAEGVLSEVGIKPTDAITLFYQQIVHRHGIPFQVALPNETTRRAIADAKARRGLTTARNASDLLAMPDGEDEQDVH